MAKTTKTAKTTRTVKRTNQFAKGLALVFSVTMGFPFMAHSSEPGDEGPTRFAAYGVEIPPLAPDRRDGEGIGPFKRLVIDNVMLVDGLGSPPRGPVSIVVTNDTISSIRSSAPKPEVGEHRVDGKGMTALPGFIDAHTHIGNPYEGVVGPITPPEYVFKLWLAHGITTVREAGSVMGLGWTVEHAKRSEDNRVAAPSIVPYAMFPGQGLGGAGHHVSERRA